MLAPARRRAALVVAFTAIFLSVPISQAHALPLFGFSGTTIAFPSTAVGGTSAGIAVTVTNVSASTQVVAIAGGAPGDANFGGVTNCSGATLAAGASCTVTYTFTPQTSGPHSASTSFTANGESSGTISLSGTATPGFSIAPTTLAFPATVVGDASAVKNVVVTNLASSPQVLTLAGGAPGDANFSAVTNCSGATLASGASCTVSYWFAPQTVGPHSATTSFTINGQSSGTISLSGTATPGFSIAPTTIAFPTTTVGNSSAGIDVVVTNLATSPQVLTMAGGAPGDPNFSAVQACSGVTLAAGASCVVTYTFVPQTAGAHFATTSFTINGQSSGTISLSGTTDTFLIAPTSLSFPTTAVGAISAGQDVVVTNRSTTPQTVTVAGGGPGDPNFAWVQNCAGVTLAPNASCAFTFTFAPQTAGPHSATTTFTVNDQSSGTISLTGTAPSATPTPTTSASPSAGPGGVVLADTGSSADPLAAAGAALTILVGASLVLWRRR
jgi:LPXTG-motif cell wall-anchored protein